MKKVRMGIGWLLAVLLAANFFQTISYGKEGKTAADEEEFVMAVYEGMLSGNDEIVIRYNGRDYKEIHERFLDEIIDKVFEIDDPENPHDFDYMRYNLEEIGIRTQTEAFWIVTITITPKWKESKRETEETDQKVKEVMKGLDITQCNNFEKVKKIHDYIVEQVEYDESLEYYTAHNALMMGKATCQGYMLLTYRLLTEAGVPARCIDGTATNQGQTESHGWNLVKVGAYWYNLDTTWDDPVLIGAGRMENEEKDISYDYFLKGNIEFSKDHERDARYKTIEFKQQYPTSSLDYDEKNPPEEMEEEETVPAVKMVVVNEPVDQEEPPFNYMEAGIHIFLLVFGVIIVGNIVLLIRQRRMK